MRKNYCKIFLQKSRLRPLLLAAICSVILVSTTTLDAYARDFYEAAPDRLISGKVTDDKGAPLAGVSVLIKGTKKGEHKKLRQNIQNNKKQSNIK